MQRPMFPPLGHLKTSAVAFIVIIGRCASLLPDFVPTWVGSPPPPRRNQWVSLKKAPRITISNVSTGQLFRLLLLYQPANPRPTRQNTDNSPLRANSQSAESQHEDTRQNTTRRKFMQSSFFVLQCTITLHGKLIPEADARGLVQFPCKNGLMNNYIFMRSGQSLLEEENVFNTNPLFL